MKMKNTSLTAACIAMIVLNSCEKTVFIDVPEIDSKIVMNGILSPTSGLWLNVSESVITSTPMTSSYTPVENATVRIYQDDQLVTTITENNAGNYYNSEFGPRMDHEYEISVSAYGFPGASATVTIPDRVDIVDFDTSSVVRSQFYYDQVLYKDVDFNLNFTVMDPVDTRNYYMLGIYYWENDAYHPLHLETEDLIMNIHIKDGVDVLAWDDTSFDGETREFDVRFRGNNYVGFETTILVSLYSIEKNYFDYLKTYSQNFTVLNDGALLYEPVIVSTNIDGGYGIMAAVSTSSLIFDYTF